MKIRTSRRRQADDLNAALCAVSEFNRIIVAADTKVGFLLTTNGFALMGLVTSTRTSRNVLVSVIATVLEIVLLVCMGYLAATLRPSLQSAGTTNWFSFPSFPVETNERPAEPLLADQAWRQAATLAQIARRKYRRFRVALRWSALSLVVFLCWFTAVLFSTTNV
ncbi:Pycsar system effector family protein [Nocardia sp. NPDC051052]|uniref:Pycsar system effector family protein n=1 Tax=Nocardia sp. NPDC051052 TaxID=3364322 RepID=UPI00378FF439